MDSPNMTSSIQNTTIISGNYESSAEQILWRFLSIGGLQNLLYTIIPHITIARLIFVLLAWANLKNLPFIWTLRVVNAFRFCTKIMRPEIAPDSSQIFQPLITSSKTPWSEVDIYMHKSNSTYFADLDIARIHLVCTLFSSGIEHIRGGTSAINRGGSKKPFFGLALGAVSCNFKRELKPHESYEMWTRVLSWDEKWIFIVTHFVRKGSIRPKEFSLYPEQNVINRRLNTVKNEKSEHASIKAMDANEAVVATALSKCVFKAGRRTISPMLMMKYSGLLPVDQIDEALPITADQPQYDELSGSESGTRRSSASTDSGVGFEKEEHMGAVGLSEMELIERERRRGMSAASFLGSCPQTALEEEFSGKDSLALGRHTDGAGIIGVASTLAQLAGLKRDKVL